jgi:uracil-DNA glycosylase
MMSAPTSAPTKLETYRELVACRRDCHACAGLRNPAEPDLAAFDSDEIGPWTRLRGDLDARLMIVAQDWGDVRFYNANRGLDDMRNPTMRTLARLLRDTGIPDPLAGYDPAARGLFLTNAVLCLKDGGLQATVRDEWFRACGARFLRPTIELVAPRVVVAMGARSYTAIMQAWSRRPGAFRDAVASPDGALLPCGSRVLAVYHCGNRVLNMTRGYEDQRRDWERVARWLE